MYMHKTCAFIICMRAEIEIQRAHVLYMCSIYKAGGLGIWRSATYFFATQIPKTVAANHEHACCWRDLFLKEGGLEVVLIMSSAP